MLVKYLDLDFSISVNRQLDTKIDKSILTIFHFNNVQTIGLGLNLMFH